MLLTILNSAVTERFNAHKREWSPCTRCTIGEIAHRKVFVRGTIPADILFIGEAPGITENATGWPFIGKSGKLLNEWIDHAQHGYRQAVNDTLDMMPGGAQGAHCSDDFTFAVSNLVLCRPTDRLGGPNRAPTSLEISNCSSRLVQLLGIVRPRGIVALGKPAKMHVKGLRSTVFRGLPILNLVHPASVLRNGGSEGQKNSLASFVEQLFSATHAPQGTRR